MEFQVIDNKEKYEAAVAELERLLEIQPKVGSSDSEKLKLLGLLIANYEEKRVRFEAPTPVDALEFRMSEMGLKQTDLIQFIGSKSKVSEVLSGKRPLSLAMIRSLSEGLNIPADLLVGKSGTENVAESEIGDLPIKEMVKKGWIGASKDQLKENYEELGRAFLKTFQTDAPALALWRTGIHTRALDQKDRGSMFAWAGRIASLAKGGKGIPEYKIGSINEEYIKRVAKLSAFEKGPLLASEYLRKSGVVLVIEEHLTGTKLDGGIILLKSGRPVIGLTLRYDRLDNFWFTLAHELAHLGNHIDSTDSIGFLDNLEIEDGIDIKEDEADQIARNAFIPRNVWTRSDAYKTRAKEAVIELARELEISPAVVAGRLRKELGLYKDPVLTQLVGQGGVRKLFGV
jgi:HTH-type transcriptional regulator/antitoxin HigA